MNTTSTIRSRLARWGRACVRTGLALALVAGTATAAAAQGHGEQAHEPRGSENIEVLSHVPLGPRLSVSDIELEQELDRPFAYVGRMQYGQRGPKGMDVVSLEDPGDGKVIYRWRIENQELHQPTGGMDVKYFRWKDRYYVVQSLQFGQGGPDTAAPASDFELLTSLTGISGVRWGHTFTPGPRGRYAVAETEYQYAPLRIFDLEPGLEGEVETISSPIAAWTADWRHLPHNHEVRWPLVFVSHYLDGLQVFTMADPENPKTVGWYDTYLGPPNTNRYSQFNGAFGVDVRNEDGLIVISDMTTGFWAFRMEGFQDWSGEQHGVPDVSSAQHWDGVPGGG